MSDYGGDDEYEYDFEEDDDALYYTEEPVYEAVGFTFVFSKNGQTNGKCSGCLSNDMSF